ncbi:Protein of unknown function [Pyronema omphalodes CBS 100304]|uniref:Uncharacterized protein n=1 Tax=Pyronema omphalodes (strain CBS 100304) TaxID=1076935 RepID=U4LW64_PYROM|nr:Protein of unknown function [Pyronema omphalodes CBS 100304]
MQYGLVVKKCFAYVNSGAHSPHPPPF